MNFHDLAPGIDPVYDKCQSQGCQNCGHCTLIECCDNQLHGFKVFSDDYTTFIARDAEHAARLCAEFNGDDPEHFDPDDYEFDELTIDLDKAHRLWADEDMDVRIIKTWRRWFVDNGPGFLSSSEY